MKVIFYLFFATAFLFTSCSKDNDIQSPDSSENITVTTRASNLGYSDIKSYLSSVSSQCSLGNHENCDVLEDGTHQICTSADHDGVTHDGKHFNGTSKGHHSHYNRETHDLATCTDATHNHGENNNGNTHDVATCSDRSHNHGTNNGGDTHDVATCTDATHNHGGNNNNSHHNGGGHHK